MPETYKNLHLIIFFPLSLSHLKIEQSVYYNYILFMQVKFRRLIGGADNDYDKWGFLINDIWGKPYDIMCLQNENHTPFNYNIPL